MNLTKEQIEVEDGNNDLPGYDQLVNDIEITDKEVEALLKKYN